MRKGLIYKFMIAFVALVVIGLLPFKAYADTTITITSQPVDYSGAVGEVATFSVVAEGEGLSYQWQTNKSGTWNDSTLTGAKTSTLSIEINGARNGYKFRCNITDSNGSTVTSGEATLSVAADAITITSNPANYSGVAGSVATFSVAAQGEGLKYQWQVNKNGTWANSSMTGSKTDTLSVDITSARNGYKFRCVITDTVGNSKTSGEATLTVSSSDAITITTQPENYSGAVGGVAPFTVVAEGTGLKYQWQVNSSGTWKDSSMPGSKTNTLSVDITNARNGYKFRCVITDADGNTKTSGEATLTVASSDAITITAQPENYSGSVGSVAPFTVVAEGTGLKYQWQVNSSGSWKDSSMPGAKTNTLSVDITNARNGYKFRCVITDADGNTKTSGEAALTVVAKTTITVTLNGGDGLFANGKKTTTAEVDPGYILLNNMEQPELKGYVFRGWVDAQGKAVNYVNITAETTFFADYRKINYLTLDANGGHFDNNEEELVIDFTCNIYFFDDDYDRPVRDGYRFAGWMLDGQLISRRITVTEDVTLTAQWIKIAYVTYNANGGNWYIDGVETDTYIDEQLAGYYYNIGCDDPYREGFEFAGWMLNNDWAPGKILLNEDIELTAVWRTGVEVTYDPNGGGWGIYDFDNEEYVFETTPRVFDVEAGPYRVNEWWPERVGYDFAGWSTDPKAAKAETEYDSFVTADTVFYAVWKPQGVIRYDAGIGCFGNGDKVKINYISDGEYYYIGEQHPWVDDDNYRFICWVDIKGNVMDDEEILVTSDTDITVYAKWTKNINIYFNGNGAYFEYDRYEDNVFIEHVETELENDGWRNSGEYYMPDKWAPEREGYEFLGWALMEGDELGDIIEEPILLPEEDVTFYAKWLKLTKVYYLANGGGYSNYDESRGETAISYYRYYKPGEEFELDGWHPEFEDRNFAGWTTVANDITTRVPERMIAGNDLDLFAYWYQPKTITYRTNLTDSYWTRYDNNDNVVVTVLLSEITQTANDFGELDIEEWRPEAENQPYEFLGYSLEEFASQPSFLPGQHIEFLESDLTLYGVWQKLPVITYDAGEGVFRDGNKIREDWGRPGHMYAVRCENPEDREGYNFIGWADSDGVIRNGDEWFRLNAGDELVFTAVWEERTTCTITYIPNGGTFGYEEDDYEQEEAVIGDYRHIGTRWPDREGYEFMGWSEDPDATEGLTDWNQIITEDTIVYAVWAKRTTITLDAGEYGKMWVWYDDVWDWEQDPPELIEEGHDSLERFKNLEVTSGVIIPTYLIDCPDREGYWFEGWMDSEGKIVNYLTVGDEDITLYAYWTKIYYITFDAGEGQFLDGNSSTTWETEAGRYLQMDWVEIPEREGFIFAGWSLDGEYITYYTVEDEDVVFEAIWIPVNG